MRMDKIKEVKKKYIHFYFIIKIKMTLITVLIEALFVGVMTIILGLILQNIGIPNVLFLFLLGFFIHLICEMSGLNRWYCKYGSACNFDKVHPASA